MFVFVAIAYELIVKFPEDAVELNVPPFIETYAFVPSIYIELNVGVKYEILAPIVPLFRNDPNVLLFRREIDK